MSSYISTPNRFSFALLMSAILISGCSSSSSSSSNSQSPAETDSIIVEGSNGTTDNSAITNNNEADAGLTNSTLEPVTTSLQLMPAKTFRLSWQPSVGAEFYRVLENPDGVSGFTQVSADLDASTNTFDHRVALYKRVNARYIVQACIANSCVDSDEQMVSGSLSSGIGYIKASNTDEFDFFGDAVSLSADGNTLAIGAYGEDATAQELNGSQTDNSTINSGAVYVFVLNNSINNTGTMDDTSGVWQQQAYLKASNADAGDSFGSVVSLSADGNTLAVGAWAEDSTIDFDYLGRYGRTEKDTKC